MTGMIEISKAETKLLEMALRLQADLSHATTELVVAYNVPYQAVATLQRLRKQLTADTTEVMKLRRAAL